MKKLELKTMIREIVREEVRLELRSFLKEYKQTQVKDVKKPVRTKQAIKPKSSYSKNSVINDILNETANTNDWETLGGKPFSTDSMSSILANEYGQPSNGQSPAIDPNIPTRVSDAMTRDYRGLMQAIDKKKNGSIT